MSRRGVWQLNKLVFNYCDHSGSSRGAREFIKSYMPEFRKSNPQLLVEERIDRGHHPWMHGIYKNGRERSVPMRNSDPVEILRQAMNLRNNIGRKSTIQVKKRVVTSRPSIQGEWNMDLQAKLLADDVTK